MISTAACIVTALGAVALSSGTSGQPPVDYSGDCTSAGCHDQFGKQEFVHSPAEDGECDACHEATDTKKHRFRSVAPKESLCLECHDEFEGSTQHAPVTEGKCLACHDPHAGANRSLLRAPTPAQICTGCHQKITEHKFLHGPAAAGACTICHNPHASDHSALLSAENRALCVGCHEALAAHFTETAYQHGPATEDCAECHDPHGGDNRMNLKATAPGLCLDCHDGIADTLDEAEVKHDAHTTGRSCAGCHDPHAGNDEHLLLMEPMDLCLSCHDKELDSGAGKMGDIAGLLKENPNHHGSIREKNCTACHVSVHGGEHFRLLLGAYPAGFYAPFEERRYAFCFHCHEADVVRDPRTDKLTNFRNGDSNLHYVHVNREKKGRTCRACHSTHASKNPKHLAESVPFGSWKIPISFEQSPTGGSCLPGCHKLYRYDREKAVVNLPPSPSQPQ